MKSLLEQEELIRGSDEDFTLLKCAFYEKVIPRLLRPLETGGRDINPCLIHSDLSLGNIKSKTDVDELCMFDACAYWGHNEGMFPDQNSTTSKTTQADDIVNSGYCDLPEPSLPTQQRIFEGISQKC